MFSRIAPRDLDLKELWAGDLYGRKEIADQFCGLLKTTRQSTTIGVSAPYGYGKTFFLTRLREQIKAEGGWAIYVNAWEYDYLDNPLIAILDSLKSALSDLPNKKKSKIVVQQLAKSAAPAIAKMAAKRGLGLILGEGNASDVLEAAGDISKDAIEKSLEQLLKDHPTQAILQNLRDEIAKIVRENIKSGQTYGALFIIVDELDRAKPSYSVGFMESVKHLLHVPGVVLIIGCDRQVFATSARHQFGQSLPIEGYIRRLFDYWIDLPRPESKKYIQYCADSLGIITDGLVNIEDIDYDASLNTYSEYFRFGSLGQSLSLRMVEQAVCQLNIYLRTVEKGRWRHIAAVGFLQALSEANPELFERYVHSADLNDRLDAAKEIIRFWKLENEFSREWAIIWMIGWTLDRLNQEIPDADVLLAQVGVSENLSDNMKRLLTDRMLRRSDGLSTAQFVSTRLREILNVYRR
jgi:hypothetical protein